MDIYAKIPVFVKEKDDETLKSMLKNSIKIKDNINFIVSESSKTKNITESMIQYSKFGIIVDSLYENNINYAIVKVNSSWHHIFEKVLQDNRTMKIEFNENSMYENSMSSWKLFISNEEPQVKSELYAFKKEKIITIPFLEAEKPTVNGNLYPKSLIKRLLKEAVEKKVFLTMDGCIDNKIENISKINLKTIIGEVIGSINNKLKIKLIGLTSDRIEYLLENNTLMIAMPRGVAEVVPRMDGKNGNQIKSNSFKLLCLDLIYNIKSIPEWMKNNSEEYLTTIE